MWTLPTQPLQWAVVGVTSLVAAVWDVRTHRIPNRLTGPVLVAGFVWAAVYGGPPGLADAAAASAVMMFLFVVLFVFAGGGAGDAKLMGALGPWLGLVNGLFALGCVLLAGGVLAIAAALAKKRLLRVLANIAVILSWLVLIVLRRGSGLKIKDALPCESDMELKVPYAVAIFAGVCLAAVGVPLWRAYR